MKALTSLPAAAALESAAISPTALLPRQGVVHQHRLHGDALVTVRGLYGDELSLSMVSMAMCCQINH